MIDLSIGIVIYRNYDEVFEALKSIETFTDTHIVKRMYVIDNSAYSFKNAAQEQFVSNIESFKDVIYIDSKANLGFGKGHNAVIELLDSQYHAIVNPDILLREDSFSHILRYLAQNPQCGMCIPKLVNQEGSMQLAYRREVTLFDLIIRMIFKNKFKARQKYHTMQEKDFENPFQVPFAQGSFLVIRTDIFKNISGFDDRYFMYLEDADLCRQVNSISQVMYCPNTTVIHKWEKGSHKNIKLFIIHLKSMLSYFMKWGFAFW